MAKTATIASLLTELVQAKGQVPCTGGERRRFTDQTLPAVFADANQSALL
jgi:hypothetical protein